MSTICSTMHCYNWAEETGDPAKPPFCDSCKAKKVKSGPIAAAPTGSAEISE
jgi:hypothetical protein